MSTATTPTRFQSLSLADLPLTIRVYREEDNVRVWETTVTELPVGVVIPALGTEHGPVWVEMEFGDGEVVEEHPDAR